MITIFAEKPDVGTKIAAALDAIVLSSGDRVDFDHIQKYEKQIKAQRAKQGYFKIRHNGEETYVTWGIGHLCELKQAQDYNKEYKQWKNIPLPFIPESYELKCSKGMEKQLRLIKNIFDHSDLIICATDDDREGDLIFDYIYRYLNCSVPFKRALFNQQSKEEWQKAFRKENLVDGIKRKPVIEAGRGRSAGDFVVGANLTTAMTLKFPGNNVLSVGRVQTAVLSMLVEFGENCDLVLHIYKDEEFNPAMDKDYSNIVTIHTAQDGKWIDDTEDVYVTDGSLYRELERINSYTDMGTL